MAKVLLVDDEVDVIRALRMRFKANGFDVVTASDGVQATSVALRERPDLIVLDIGMPGGDGFVVAERLRSSSVTRLIPIIVLSARHTIMDTQKARDLDIERYLTKPFDPDELIRTANNLLGLAA